ncbi:penicillin-binding transpeptidase domain-containing protein [Tenggerimyces flavus]|uniref:Penicillin-binding transpeptidase domain-containing protein n=1 Tax=Tenggerimyces flavus TaxID=1708749 RepID=A0ABV7YNU8_9ACTN|nr:penicillin-binding transpeptidase domain-containing protein [Tenggerimyces flavus]MBM7789424.1 penicillin-binding protein 2 [Tenggerimyces flavus]
MAILQLLVLTLVAVLLGRLWIVQVARPVEPSAPMTDVGELRTISVPAVRGRILDRNGRPLVDNESALTVLVDPSAVGKLDKPGRTALYDRLGSVLGKPGADLAARTVPCGTPGARRPPVCWSGQPYEPVPIARNVSTQAALAISERSEHFPGVVVDSRATRRFPKPDGVSAAHLLGYVAPVNRTELDASHGELRTTDLVGRAGLEKQYDALLRGTPGQRTVRIDAQGRVLSVVSERPAKPGADLVTNLDVRIQALAERELAKTLAATRTRFDKVTKRKYVADAGAIVVLDARTGGVIAMASNPGYDPSLWLDGLTSAERKRLLASGDAPLVARATQGEYAPGSTFKVVSATAALTHGFRTSEQLPCPGTMEIVGRTFRNFESLAYGDLSLADALAVSCDTFFYQVGLDHRRDDAIEAAAAAFGFGRRTGLDLPGERAGHVGRQTSYAGHAALLAIGQGDTTVTPLQLARAYAALANGGSLLQPSLRKQVPKVAGKLPLTPSQLRYLQAALRKTTVSGTGAAPFAGFRLDKTPVASKTGTAEVDGRQSTSWFASFDQRYAVVMMVSQGGTGAATSGPAVRRLWEALR